MVKYLAYRIKAFVLHTMWDYGLVRTVWDHTKDHAYPKTESTDTKEGSGE